MDRTSGLARACSLLLCTAAIDLCLGTRTLRSAGTTYTLEAPARELTDQVTIRGGASANTNFAGEPILVTRASNNPSYERRTLLKFDVRQIPTGTHVTRALLRLTVHAGGSDTSRRLGAFWIETSFREREATWNERKDNVRWNTPGGDLGAQAATADVSSTPGSVVTFDLTKLIQNVVDRTVGSGWARLAIVDLDPASRGSYREYESSAMGGSRGPRLAITTGTSSPPPPSGPTTLPGDIVMYASAAPVVRGTWRATADTSAAGGAAMRQADAGVARQSPSASPSDYFELVFEARAGIDYHLWMRGKAQGNSAVNDSVFVQFSRSVDASGHPIDRIGTTAAETVNMEDCTGCGLSGWGWQDNGSGVNGRGRDIRFQTTGPQRIRVQTREDGLGIDQIVLSAKTFLSSAPGTRFNDATVLPRSHTLPKYSHIFVIVFENREFGQVIGNATVPYINSLASTYGLGTAYTAITHPSLPNYMGMTGGATAFGGDCVGCVVNARSVADQIEQSGRTWKGYMGDMPADCATTDSGRYAAKHNPFVHYTPIVSNASRCRSHVVPLSEFYTDLSSANLPNFVWITPDMCSDMHDCAAAVGDRWLESLLPRVLGSSAFRNSVVYLVWDEGQTTAGGGGWTPFVVISPDSAPRLQSSRPANHYDLLRTIEDAWGLPPLGQAAAGDPLTQYVK
jgi:phosphatidylinositol-3-phosphatase